ncbi:hypothetical protein RJ40_10275 [Methanofollis aquaemaris]|uniref:D-glucuronyl C5-epimerase C-terminal domain-containing protein n=1 Tax=Methanofollis aquaemaris TaxID=126734 RepID=A0A8A3S8E9_9EURY|nr:D-glucuronyl C5-epimerase family protein [Methanofollis aquaemaris]QSZ67856.1 hypothetical protein RJ40_10275 [Methanofollis aquaemaris]
MLIREWTKYILIILIFVVTFTVVTLTISGAYRNMAYIILLIIHAFVLTHINSTLSIHNSLTIYGKLANYFKLHGPNVNHIDNNGVPYVDYGNKQGVFVGTQRNPLTIADKANDCYKLYVETKNCQFYNQFLSCVNYLEDLCEWHEDSGRRYVLYPYNFITDKSSQDLPWYSAMAQTAALVTHLNAYKLTCDAKYLYKCNLIINSLRVPMASGGVLHVDPEDGGLWFEEVACKSNADKPSSILNGNLFCLLDLYKYYQDTKDSNAKELFDLGVQEVKRHLHEYDLGYWTAYDRQHHFAYDYHYVHLKLLNEMYTITEDPFFEKYYHKWRFYIPLNPLWARKHFAGFILNLCVMTVIASSLSIFISLI